MEDKAKDLLLINALLHLMEELTAQSRVILKKLAVPHYTTNSVSSLMEPKGSLPCSRTFTTGPYREPDKSSPHFPILFLQVPF
jgi:hypothetical protein